MSDEKSYINFTPPDVDFPEFMEDALEEIGLEFSMMLNRATDGTAEWSIQLNKKRYAQGVPLTEVLRLMNDVGEQLVQLAKEQEGELDGA